MFWRDELTCHGYLIDELWLIASSQCFLAKTGQLNQSSAIDYSEPGRDAEANGWRAEISYEHYGNHDYQSIETNRRNIKEILLQPSPMPSIVLAKLERPVRFR